MYNYKRIEVLSMEELILPGESLELEIFYEIAKEEYDISDYMLGE